MLPCCLIILHKYCYPACADRTQPHIICNSFVSSAAHAWNRAHSNALLSHEGSCQFHIVAALYKRLQGMPVVPCAERSGLHVHAAGPSGQRLLEQQLWTPVSLLISSVPLPGANAGTRPHTMAVTVSPGVRASNLTPWGLLLTPSPVLDPDMALSLAPASTSLLQPVWHPAHLSGSSQPAEPGVYVTCQSTARWPRKGVHVPLIRPSKRCRAVLPLPHGSTAMLTHRVLLTRGQLHLVLFVDCQPACVLTNSLATAVEVGPDRSLSRLANVAGCRGVVSLSASTPHSTQLQACEGRL